MARDGTIRQDKTAHRTIRNEKDRLDKTRQDTRIHAKIRQSKTIEDKTRQSNKREHKTI